jgi:hypothetical protein
MEFKKRQIWEHKDNKECAFTIMEMISEENDKSIIMFIGSLKWVKSKKVFKNIKDCNSRLLSIKNMYDFNKYFVFKRYEDKSFFNRSFIYDVSYSNRLYGKKDFFLQEYERFISTKTIKESFIIDLNNEINDIRKTIGGLQYKNKKLLDIIEQTKQKEIKKEEREKRIEQNRLKKQPKNNVYVMIDKKTGLHKIGISIKPRVREKTLQSEKPDIKLLFYYEAEKTKEKELHKIFKEKRIRGEWFDLTNKDLGKIREYLS